MPGVPEGCSNFPYVLQFLPEPGRKDREETDGKQLRCVWHIWGAEGVPTSYPQFSLERVEVVR